MGTVFSIHEITLRSEMEGREAEFERFITEVGIPAWKESAGVKLRLLQGVRGDRMGSYTLLLEWPSVEAFKQYIPLGPGEFTKAGQEKVAQYAAVYDRYASYVGSTRFTDYVEAVG